jgi:hypothetical protein
MNKKNKNTIYDDKTIASFSSSINTSHKHKYSITDDITINAKDLLSYKSAETNNTVIVNNDDKVNKITEYDDESIASFGSSVNLSSNNDSVSIHTNDITVNSEDKFSYKSIVTEKTYDDIANEENISVSINSNDIKFDNEYSETIEENPKPCNIDEEIKVNNDDKNSKISKNSKNSKISKNTINSHTNSKNTINSRDDSIKNTINIPDDNSKTTINSHTNSKNTINIHDDNSKNKDSKTFISNLTNHSYTMLDDDYLSNKGDDVFSYVSNITSSDNKTPKHFVPSYKSLYKELHSKPKPFPYIVPNENIYFKEDINKNHNHEEKTLKPTIPNNEQSNLFKPLIFNHEVEPSYNVDKTYKIDKKRVIIDVAVLCQEYTNVETICDDNIVNLDEIPVTKEMFQAIFYPYKDNFGINKDFMINHKELLSLVSFLPEHRSINNNKKKFYLLEELIANIERNLNISRNCFTKDSLVELTNEIIGIKTLLDINCCSVLSSLSWPNVLEVIENYKLVNHSDESIVPVCVVNIVFKTPTTDVKNTTIRFNYKITNYC